MFCTNCGAQALGTDRFCPNCGALLKNARHAPESAAARPAPTAAPVYDAASAVYGDKKQKQKKKMGAAPKVIIVFILLTVLLLLGFAAQRGYFGDLSAIRFGGCAPVSASDGVSLVQNPSASDVEGATASQATTSTQIPTYHSTESPVTTTTVNQAAKDAAEIREMLVSRKWKTNLEGYDATITFRKDGTATITVKIGFLFITKEESIEAEYSVSDRSHAVIVANYGGTDYGISGYMKKASDTELVVERDKNMGTVTLKAA